jgi:hypothetical protein
VDGEDSEDGEEEAAKGRAGEIGDDDRVGDGSRVRAGVIGRDDLVDEDEAEEEHLERDEDSDNDPRESSGEGGRGIPKGSITGDNGSLGEASEKDTVLDANPNERKEENGGIKSNESVVARESRFKGNSVGSQSVSIDPIEEREEKEERAGRIRTHESVGDGGTKASCSISGS